MKSKDEPFLYEPQKRFGTPRVLIVPTVNDAAAREGGPPAKLARDDNVSQKQNTHTPKTQHTQSKNTTHTIQKHNTHNPKTPTRTFSVRITEKIRHPHGF